MNTTTNSRSRVMKLLFTTLVLLGLGIAATALWGERVAEAYIRGGFIGVPGGGGVVAVSRTTVVPGYGVTRAVVVGGRYRRLDAIDPPLLFNPRPIVPGRPGVNVGWTARGIRVGRISAGPSTGVVFRYGPGVATLPGGCASVFWRGASAYRCGASMYIYDLVNGAPVYYPAVY